MPAQSQSLGSQMPDSLLTAPWHTPGGCPPRDERDEWTVFLSKLCCGPGWPWEGTPWQDQHWGFLGSSGLAGARMALRARTSRQALQLY